MSGQKKDEAALLRRRLSLFQQIGEIDAQLKNLRREKAKEKERAKGRDYYWRHKEERL